MIRFESNELEFLKARMQRGLAAYSVRKNEVLEKLFLEIVLWGDDGAGVQISNEMHDIAPRLEVGSLRFRPTSSSDQERTRQPIPFDFHQVSGLTRLTLDLPEVSAESGMLISFDRGKEIVLLPADYPYHVAIKADFVAEPFSPEYELDDYRKLPLDY